jgi:hypothetical protein
MPSKAYRHAAERFGEAGGRLEARTMAMQRDLCPALGELLRMTFFLNAIQKHTVMLRSASAKPEGVSKHARWRCSGIFAQPLGGLLRMTFFLNAIKSISSC